MDENTIRQLLEAVASGQTPVDQAVQALRALPYAELEFATLDHHRALRWGFAKVVYCPPVRLVYEAAQAQAHTRWPAAPQRGNDETGAA